MSTLCAICIILYVVTIYGDNFSIFFLPFKCEHTDLHGNNDKLLPCQTGFISFLFFSRTRGSCVWFHTKPFGTCCSLHRPLAHITACLSVCLFVCLCYGRSRSPPCRSAAGLICPGFTECLFLFSLHPCKWVWGWIQTHRAVSLLFLQDSCGLGALAWRAQAAPSCLFDSVQQSLHPTCLCTPEGARFLLAGPARAERTWSTRVDARMLWSGLPRLLGDNCVTLSICFSFSTLCSSTKVEMSLSLSEG